MSACVVLCFRVCTASPDLVPPGGLQLAIPSRPSFPGATFAASALAGRAASPLGGLATLPFSAEHVSGPQRSAVSSPSLMGNIIPHQQLHRMQGPGDNPWLSESSSSSFSGSPLQRGPRTTVAPSLLAPDRTDSATVGGMGGMARASALIVEGRSRGQSFTALGALKRPEKSSSSLWPGLGLAGRGTGTAGAFSRPDSASLAADLDQSLAVAGDRTAERAEVPCLDPPVRPSAAEGQASGGTSCAGDSRTPRTARSSIMVVSITMVLILYGLL